MLTVVEQVREDDAQYTRYAGNLQVTCSNGEVVNVTAVTVTVEDDDEDYYTVGVEHSGNFIYNDAMFETAISAAIGRAVQFTEQGMQDDGYCSMEIA